MTRTDFKRNVNQSMKRIADELVYMMQLINHVREQGISNDDIDAIISDLSDAYNASLWRLDEV